MVPQETHEVSLAVAGEHLRNRLGSGIVVLGSRSDGKAALLVAVTPNLAGRFDACKLVRQVAPLIRGGGGGRPEMAEAGGKAPEAIPKALEESLRVIENTALTS